VRPSAFNYLEASWNSGNNSILQKRVGILLGLRFLQTRSLTDVFVERGLELISDEPVDQSEGGAGELELADLSEMEASIYQSFQEVPTEESTGINEDRLFNEITFLKDNSLSDSILRNGIYLDRYLVGSTGEDEYFHLLFRRDQRELWWNLASYGTREEAVTSANDLSRLLIRLNVESEGLHIVEHILLRPLGTEPVGRDIEVPDDFYPFTISVVFPGWTARFHDAAFRRLAEETVQLNCPAHIYPEFHWLDFQRMREFEGLYQQWLETKSSDRANPQEVDAASTQLIKFILDMRSAGAPLFWSPSGNELSFTETSLSLL